ncbi:FAD-dependent oxidoreductase [Sphingomicrobium flavum]|uniref:FAD-dependent oxidoreductase n=1 Tax=Sphingomicrobium flavum TaxID=1229164 RepID=UPI0021AD795E|nr:GMC family oxidoreductase [Sphingomicrobium flavum]
MAAIIPMRIDLATTTPESPLHGDVAIIGSGAAGQAIARRLIEQGKSVILIESGGIDHEKSVADMNAGESVGEKYYPLDHARLRFFGGTTAIWGGRCARLDPVDYRSRDHVPHSGWPIDEHMLEPYLAQAERQLGIAVPPGKRPPPDRLLVALSDHGVDPLWWRFDGRFDRFGHEAALDLFDHPACTILLHATVREIRLSADAARVEALEVVSQGGANVAIHATHYVLAAGGIENPRLLLASNSVASAGIGNGHDLVGRFFMEHPHGRGGRITGNKAWAWLTAFSKRLQDGLLWAPALRLSEEQQRRRGILNSALTIAARRPKGATLPVAKRLYLKTKHNTAPTKFGRTLWQATKRSVRTYTRMTGPLHPYLQHRLGQLDISLILRAEQSPNPDSRITLTGDRDAAGVPRVRLDWRLNRLDIESAKGLVAGLGEAVAAIGHGAVEATPWLAGEDWEFDDLVSAHPIGGFHHMGTTRMADSPSQGVTDGWGRVHGLPNLYIAGSSLFPTGGWANPTLTIIALALRTADRIADEL